MRPLDDFSDWVTKHSSSNSTPLSSIWNILPIQLIHPLNFLAILMISPPFSPTVVPPNTWPHVSSFIIGLQVAVGHMIKCNSKDKIRIRMSDNNGNTLHADLHGWIFVPGLNRHLFSITKFVENGHRATFQKHTITVYFGPNKFPVTIPIPTSHPKPTRTRGHPSKK